MSPSTRTRNLVLVLVVILCVVVTFRYTNNDDYLRFPSSSNADGSLPFPRPVTPTISPEVAQRIRALSDRTERMQAIYDALPRERTWPRQLPYGFKWNDDPAHENKITTSMSNEQAENEFYKFIERYPINCPQQQRFGSPGGGGWHVCVTGPYNFTAPCLVYSVGMGGEWSFDRDVMNRTGCADMAFDPTLGKGDHKPFDLMWFHNIGMSGKNGINDKKWKVRTFGKLLEQLGHTQAVVDILKMDIEYSEWEAFESIFLEGSLANVKQFMFEFHTDELVSKDTTAKDFTYFWLMWKTLERLGFKYWAYETNMDGRYKSKVTQQTRACCGNAYFVNVNLLLSS